MDSSYLLSDSQIQQFITNGYLQLHVDCGPNFHQEVYQQIESMFEGEGNVGNNILPRVPKIQRVFDHPALQGALISLLGEGYTMNPHRHATSTHQVEAVNSGTKTVMFLTITFDTPDSIGS